MTIPPDDRMTELQSLFFESAEELVQKLNEEALCLEKSPGDPETSRCLRRTVHTLKGDSAACNYRELSELAHAFEDVLALDNPAATRAVPELALRAADLFAALLQAYRGNTKLPDIQPLHHDLDRLAHGKAVAPAPAKPRAETGKNHARLGSRWTEYEQLAIGRALEEGKSVHYVVVQLDPQCVMPIAARQMLQFALASLGEVLALSPTDGAAQTHARIKAVLASPKSAPQIQAKCTIPTISRKVKVLPLRRDAVSARLPVETAPVAGTGNTDAPQPVHPGAEASDAQQPIAGTPVPVPAPEHILRVDAERIDSVLNLVGELILAKSMLQQAVIEFGHRFPKDSLTGKFSDAMAFQARVLNDLQRSVMKVRMVPVDQLFRRFPRTVRDVAHQSGKEVELVLQGGDTDLDKTILDALAEPLTHLLRNAVGHGIEPAAERAAAGKRPQATLHLNAYHQGNQVVIEVSDDGGGIDVDKVRARAITQAMLKPEEAAQLTEAETLELILRPGFSTAKEVTELSGRGIGLDVVQTVLARLKGTVQIETSAGRGTTFRLRLPLTLAIIRALLFRVEHRLYALPLNAVAEITRTTEASIHRVEHYEVLQLRNDVLPLLRLGCPPEPGANPRHKVFVLVINHGDRKFGLIVDELASEEELVIKALDDQSVTTDLISGASILGDGRVVLILNLIALVDRFTRAGRETAPAAGLLSNLNCTLQRVAPPAAAAGGHA
jgi:two-component system chemotaxis sensor kinase CheA